MTDQGRTPRAGDAHADADYRRLLAELSAPPRDESVDWDALHRRIEEAATLPLARLRAAAVVTRPEPMWWELTARRARALLPLAVAASLAMFAYVQSHPVDVVEASAFDPRDAYAAAVTGDASSARVTRLLVAAASESDAATVVGR